MSAPQITAPVAQPQQAPERVQEANNTVVTSITPPVAAVSTTTSSTPAEKEKSERILQELPKTVTAETQPEKEQSDNQKADEYVIESRYELLLFSPVHFQISS